MELKQFTSKRIVVTHRRIFAFDHSVWYSCIDMYMLKSMYLCDTDGKALRHQTLPFNRNSFVQTNMGAMLCYYYLFRVCERMQIPLEIRSVLY